MSALGWLQSLGYGLRHGPEIDDAGERAALSRVILEGRLTAALHRLNPALPRGECEQVVRTLSHPPDPTLAQKNRWFHTRLIDGVDVEYKDAATGEMRGGRARLIDFDRPANNDFLAVQQLSFAAASGKLIRLDLTLFLNGLPIAIIELKDPADPEAGLETAIGQMGRYMAAVPDLFVPNVLLVASDGLLTRVGSITAGLDRFMPWRPAEGGQPTLEALIRGLLEPAALLDYLRGCVAFEEDERGEIAKKIAGYHQFRAVRKTRATVLAALKPPIGAGDGRGGVVWHTQGSGKSLTMLMLAAALIREPALANPTIIVVTDRNDLDDQLFGTFAMGRALLRQDPVQSQSRRQLKELLDRAAGGVVFTTIHKFAEGHGIISQRSNVVVMADEAHRSQYGLIEGGARWMREGLPNATFVGFTGTPLERDDKNTITVFGEYSDVYDIRQAVEDGATKPLFYESRIIKLTVDDAGAAAAEKEIELVAAVSGRAVRQVGDESVPAMQASFEKLRSFFHGLDYQPALGVGPRDALQLYVRAVDHVLGQTDGWKRLRTMVKELSAAFALAAPRPETDAIVDHLAFFQRVAAMIRKRLTDETTGGGAGRRRDIDAAVRQVIGGAVDADQVIDLFAAAGLAEARLDILSDEFLSRVCAMEHKNLALETLRKLLADQIRATERINLVQSKKFRQALEDAMLRYTNKAITTAEMISQLIDLAKFLREAQRHGQDLGLSDEETAFYDALAENGSAKQVMKSDTLRLMARELANMIRRMPKLDWTQRESVRADLRRSVRRLLAKYGYPPDLSEDATQLVLKL